MFTPSKPIPSRGVPVLAGTAVVVLALPVFVIAGWELGAWALAAGCWAFFQGVGYLLARLPVGADKLGNSGLVAMGRMLRTIVLMTILVLVTTRDTSLGLQAVVVFALAFTVELALSMISYLGGEAKTG
jgi:hypothetical protein